MSSKMAKNTAQPEVPPIDIKMECEDMTEDDYYASSAMEVSGTVTESELSETPKVEVPIKMAPPEESMTLEDFVNQESANSSSETNVQALLQEQPVTPDIGWPQVDRTSLPLHQPLQGNPYSNLLNESGMTSDSSVLTKVDAPQTKNTLLKQIIDKACLKLAREGEESLFLSVNIEKKLCSFVGTETGRQFLTKRPDVMEHFFQFCQAIYKARGDVATTTETNTEDSDILSSPFRPPSKPKTQGTTQIPNLQAKTPVTPIPAPSQHMTRSQSRGGRQTTPQNSGKEQEINTQENSNKLEENKTEGKKTPYSLRVGIKPKRFQDFETKIDDEDDIEEFELGGSDGNNEDETYNAESGSEEQNSEEAKKTAKAKRAARYKAMLEREPVEITEKDFLVDDIYTSTTNRAGNFRCTVCDKTFQWSNSYRYHLKTHPNLKIVSMVHHCEVCDSKFMTSRDLQSHCRNKHKSLNSFRCSFCDRFFSSAFQYNRHRRTCGEKHKCDKCQRTFPTKQLLSTHQLEKCVSQTSEVKVKEEVLSDPDEDQNSGSQNGNNNETEEKKDDEDFIDEDNDKEDDMNEKDEEDGNKDEGTEDKEEYKCNECLKVLRTKEGLEKHLALHQGHYKCQHCEKQFKTRHGLASHRVKFHPDKEDKYTCRVCGRKFLQAWSLYRHNLDIHGKEQIICQVCGGFFDTKEELKEHISSHSTVTSIVKYSCTECGQRYDQARYLYVHYKDVHKMRKTICRYCGVTFDSRSDLNTHIGENHSSTAPNTCNLCWSSFETEELLETHKKEHLKNPKVNNCILCGELFNSKADLDAHVVVQHSREFRFFCHVCKKGFKHRGKLKVHMISHKESRPYQCDTCGMCFKMHSTLMCHIRRHQGLNRHKCTFCDKKFKSIEGVRNHMLLYHITPEEAKKLKWKVYTCEHCGTMMGQKHVYMRHVRLHTGHRPWECNICGKSFTMPSALNTHKKSHLARKPYHCNYCAIGFVDLTKFNKHKMTTKHKMTVLKTNELQEVQNQVMESGHMVESEPDEEQEFLSKANVKPIVRGRIKKGTSQKVSSLLTNATKGKQSYTLTVGDAMFLNQGQMVPEVTSVGKNAATPQNSNEVQTVPQIVNNANDQANVIINVPDGMSPDLITQLLESGQLQASSGNVFITSPSLVSEGEISDATAEAVNSLLS